MRDIHDVADSVSSRKQFIDFLDLLAKDLRENEADWENSSLDSYLEALSRWIEDMDGYYTNMNLKVPQDINWSAMADMFIAARSYE